MWFVSMDTETTGLDRQNCEVTEIKATALTRTLEPVGEFYSKLQITRPEFVQDKALELNGYDEEKWKDAPHPGEVYKRFQEWLKEMQAKIPYLDEYKNKYPIALGQNPSFDLDMMVNNAEGHGVELRFSYHLFDLVTISMFMDIVNCIKSNFEWQGSYSLTKVAAANNVNMRKAHTAEVDEETHLKLLRMYIERIRNGHCTHPTLKC